MAIIDRYLIGQFLKSFVICYLSLTGLYIVFDALTNLEEFLRFGKQSGGVLPLLCSFYSYRFIMFFDRTAGILTLISAMFTVSWMQRHNEMTALQSAGISRIRIVAPLIFLAVAISLVSAANRELVIPRIRDQLARSPQDPVGNRPQTLQPRYDNRTNVLLRGKATFRGKQRIEKPDLLLPPPLRQWGKQVKAANAYYKPPQGDRPGGYLLRGVTQPGNLAELPSLKLGDEPVLITPTDAPDWLEPNDCFLVSDLTFEQLTGGEAFRQFSSTAQLISGLRNQSFDFGADVRVAIHTRFVNPLLDITLLFLGLPLVASRENRNVFLAIGICVGVTTVFLLVVITSQHLGSICLVDPALAAWAPLILFVPPAVGLAESMWR